jgi:hypothetical protein
MLSGIETTVTFDPPIAIITMQSQFKLPNSRGTFQSWQLLNKGL